MTRSYKEKKKQKYIQLVKCIHNLLTLYFGLVTVAGRVFFESIYWNDPYHPHTRTHTYDHIILTLFRPRNIQEILFLLLLCWFDRPFFHIISSIALYRQFHFEVHVLNNTRPFRPRSNTLPKHSNSPPHPSTTWAESSCGNSVKRIKAISTVKFSRFNTINRWMPDLLKTHYPQYSRVRIVLAKHANATRHLSVEFVCVQSFYWFIIPNKLNIIKNVRFEECIEHFPLDFFLLLLFLVRFSKNSR